MSTPHDTSSSFLRVWSILTLTSISSGYLDRACFNSATVKDMFGNEHYVKDIEVITTDNAMKWIKFDKSYDYWCERVYENNCMFGIVKTAHGSKLGEVQKMSYQMVNSLDESIMSNVVSESVAYVERLKQDDEFFLEYLKKNSNFSNDYDVLVALCEQNGDFTRSEYFRERKKAIIKAYVLNMKTDHLNKGNKGEEKRRESH